MFMNSMQFKLLGWSHYGFTNDAGKYIEGYKFHVQRPCMKDNFHGDEVAAISVSEKLVQSCGEPKVNNIYNCTYDQNGRLIGYALVTAQQKMPGT